jgi:7-keto-8-aminopelargonate synthetase-like enzyme
LYFGGSDYLRLSWHPEVRRAMAEAVERQGPSACASRMTTGNVPVYGRLEEALAGFFGVRSATLTSSGYLAPLVVVQALAGDYTEVLLDERAHACLVDAARWTGLPVRTFRHRDPADLERGRRGCGRGARVLVLTDGLFTHSGEVAPLAEYLERLSPSDTLVVDDAHGLAVLGEEGRGSCEWSGVDLQRCVVTGTLSKGVGVYGGVVLGKASVRRAILERSGIFTGNTALPPPCASGVLAALGVLDREGRERRQRLRRNSTWLRERLREDGYAVADGPGPMVSVATRTAAEARRWCARLRLAGVHPPWIRYPNGPAPEFFRFALSSEHTEEQVARLAEVLHECRRPGPVSRTVRSG